MELTLNIKMDEHFTGAVEMLAAALATYAKAYEKTNAYVYECAGDCGPHPGEPIEAKATVVEEQAAPSVEKTAPSVEKTAPTLTRAELQAKAARLMQVEKGKYVADLKASLEQCGAANISSLDESMFEKFNSLMADLWEVAA
jgi:hypothetical protein